MSVLSFGLSHCIAHGLIFCENTHPPNKWYVFTIIILGYFLPQSHKVFFDLFIFRCWPQFVYYCSWPVSSMSRFQPSSHMVLQQVVMTRQLIQVPELMLVTLPPLIATVEDTLTTMIKEATLPHREVDHWLFWCFSFWENFDWSQEGPVSIRKYPLNPRPST